VDEKIEGLMGPNWKLWANVHRHHASMCAQAASRLREAGDQEGAEYFELEATGREVAAAQCDKRAAELKLKVVRKT
jgi:hypothetical protein